jgi:hypothetical protein
LAPEFAEAEAAPLPDISDDPNALTPEVTKVVLKVLADLIRAKSEDGMGRQYELFIEKPDKRLFPDYYLLVERPLALKTIQAQLKKGGVYRLLGDIESDLELMCSNAKLYNEDSSPVYALSVELRDDFLKRLSEALANQKTPKKRATGKKKAAGASSVEGCEGEDEEGPKKKRARASTGGKKRSRKSESAVAVVRKEEAEEGEEEEGEDSQGEQEEEEGKLRITLPSNLFKRASL